VLINIAEQFLEQDVAFGPVCDLALDVAGLQMVNEPPGRDAYVSLQG
jgi:hypothetical protein